MNRAMIKQSALAEPAAGIALNELQAQPTQLFLLHGDRLFQHKSVAQWLLDEHSKLYCQWVKA